MGIRRSGQHLPDRELRRGGGGGGGDGSAWERVSGRHRVAQVATEEDRSKC